MRIRSAASACRVSCFAVSVLICLFGASPGASATNRTVHVGQGGLKFVDEVSGTSTSNINTGDTIDWVWSAGFHSTTSGTCTTSCTPDGLWDSGGHSTPFTYSRDFSSAGTFHYYCSVHGTAMQGTVIVTDLGPAPTVTSVNPTSGAAATTNPFTITGTNFVAGAIVTVGGANASGENVTDPTSMTATTPVLTPGTLNDVVVTNPDTQSGTLTAGWMADFLDVPQSDPFHQYVETIFRNGVTAGCSGGNYCRDTPVSRAQMAVFLLKAEHGSAYTPPACIPPGIFPDVPCPGQFTDWIERLSAEGITGGCAGGNYCPNDAVTRQQMAVFLLKTHDGSAYNPPDCIGIFDDVPCTPGVGFSDWIEELSNRNITGGCAVGPPPLYCPTNPNTRGQMAVFLTKTFFVP